MEHLSAPAAPPSCALSLSPAGLMPPACCATGSPAGIGALLRELPGEWMKPAAEQLLVFAGHKLETAQGFGWSCGLLSLSL